MKSVVDLKVTRPVTAKNVNKHRKLFSLKGFSVGLFPSLHYPHAWKSCYLERGLGGRGHLMGKTSLGRECYRQRVRRPVTLWKEVEVCLWLCPPLWVSFPASTHGERGSHSLGPTPLELGAWHRDSQRRTGRPKPAPLYWRGHLVASLSLHFLLCKLGATAAASKGCRDYSRVSVKLNAWHQVGGKRWLLVYELINIPQQVLPHPWGN